jgi:hypothetical protein
MNIKKLATAAAVAITSLLLATAAHAAVATSTVNVRNAPVNGAVVDVLRAGQQVEIDRCERGWCYVIKPGPNGWVSANYLSDDDEDDFRPAPGRPSPAPSRPDVDVNIGFSAPGFSFQIGSGGFDVRPNRPIRERDRVCFYERTNFRGDSFCARPGENLARLGRWDQEISSIRVQGDARALVCERTNFNGRCIVISRDARNLGAADDRIRSIRVR